MRWFKNACRRNNTWRRSEFFKKTKGNKEQGLAMPTSKCITKQH